MKTFRKAASSMDIYGKRTTVDTGSQPEGGGEPLTGNDPAEFDQATGKIEAKPAEGDQSEGGLSDDINKDK